MLRAAWGGKPSCMEVTTGNACLYYNAGTTCSRRSITYRSATGFPAGYRTTFKKNERAQNERDDETAPNKTVGIFAYYFLDI